MKCDAETVGETPQGLRHEVVPPGRAPFPKLLSPAPTRSRKAVTARLKASGCSAFARCAADFRTTSSDPAIRWWIASGAGDGRCGVLLADDQEGRQPDCALAVREVQFLNGADTADIATGGCRPDRGPHGIHDVMPPLLKRRREPPVDRRLHEGFHSLGLRHPDPFFPDGLHLGRCPTRRFAEDEALEHLGVGEGQELADHAAQGKTDEEGSLDAEGAKKGAGIHGELFERVRTHGGIRAAVSAGVVAQDPITCSKGAHLGVPHRQVRRQRVTQRHNRRLGRTFKAVIDADPV